jgi:DNA polymerase III delta prime subunit
MSFTIKKELATTIYDFIKYSKNNKYKNPVNSLRLILSGVEGIGKTTLIEAIATEFDCGLIHFPKNNYSEKMIHSFFQDINKLSENNIIIFNNIDFSSLLTYNKVLVETRLPMVKPPFGSASIGGFYVSGGIIII